MGSVLVSKDIVLARAKGSTLLLSIESLQDHVKNDEP